MPLTSYGKDCVAPSLLLSCQALGGEGRAVGTGLSCLPSCTDGVSMMWTGRQVDGMRNTSVELSGDFQVVCYRKLSLANVISTDAPTESFPSLWTSPRSPAEAIRGSQWLGEPADELPKFQ